MRFSVLATLATMSGSDSTLRLCAFQFFKNSLFARGDQMDVENTCGRIRPQGERLLTQASLFSWAALKD